MLRNSGFIENLHRSRRAKVDPILQDPYDLFVRRDLNKLRALVRAAARADNGVSILQTCRRLRVALTVGLGEIGWLDAPHRLSLGVHLAGLDIGFIGDERVAIL